MSATMIKRGRTDDALAKGNVELDEGLGLARDVVIDTHFIQRGRFGRLLEVVTRHPELLGIGIAEDTALLVREGRYAEVVGSDNIIVLDGREIVTTNTREAREGDALTVEHAVVHALADGYWFDLRERVFYTPRQAAEEVPAQ
jgi:cyanophycinase